MRKAATVLTLSLLLVFAGCAGILSEGEPEPIDTTTPTTADANGQNTANDPETTANQATDGGAESTTVPTRTLADDHPYVEDGTLNATALTVEHFRTLSRSKSYSLTDSFTGTDVSNGSVVVQGEYALQVDGADKRLIETVPPAMAAEVQSPVVTYQNATATCTRESGVVECRASTFDRMTYQRYLQRSHETAAIEEIGTPAFKRDGTVARDGRKLYRYTASEFRSDLSAGATSEYGENAELVSATVLVTADGYIYEYTDTAESDSDSGRVRIERTYRLTAVNGTAVDPPSWVPG